MLEGVIIGLQVAILVLFGGVIGYLYFKLKKFLVVGDLISNLKKIEETQVSDFASEGGLASVAKRQGDKMLSTIMDRVVSSQLGGFGEIIMEFVPELKEWIHDKPYGVASLIMNPAFQKLAKGAMAALGNNSQSVTMLPKQQVQTTLY